MIKILEESESKLVTINNNITSTIFNVVAFFAGIALVVVNFNSMQGSGIYFLIVLFVLLGIVSAMAFSIKIEVDKATQTLTYTKKRIWGGVPRLISFQDISKVETQKRTRRNVSNNSKGGRTVTNTLIISDILFLKNGGELVISLQKKQMGSLNLTSMFFESNLVIGDKVAAYVGVPYIVDDPMSPIIDVINNVVDNIKI